VSSSVQPTGPAEEFFKSESYVAIPLRTVHRLSIAFLTIAGAMFAIDDLAAHEMAANGPSAVPSGRVRNSFGAASRGSLGFDNRRLGTPGRPVGPADARLRPGPSADNVVSPGGPAAQPESQERHSVQGRHRLRVGSGASAGGARPHRGSTLRPGKRPRLRFDAEDWEDRSEGDDDTDLPVGASFRGMVRRLYHLSPSPADSRFASLETPSPRFPTRQPLRC
jgi:hypothetical protein